jgi:hypothetical protein
VEPSQFDLISPFWLSRKWRRRRGQYRTWNHSFRVPAPLHVRLARLPFPLCPGRSASIPLCPWNRQCAYGHQRRSAVLTVDRRVSRTIGVAFEAGPAQTVIMLLTHLLEGDGVQFHLAAPAEPQPATRERLPARRASFLSGEHPHLLSDPRQLLPLSRRVVNARVANRRPISASRPRIRTALEQRHSPIARGHVVARIYVSY